MQDIKRAKAHTRYTNKAGIRVPGVTTITGVMNKPFLVPWANRLGLQGYEVGKYVDELATVGTLAHYIIECHLKGEQPDFSDYTPNQISLAENSALKFFEWEKNNDFEVIFSEKILVSEEYQYGGQLDIYGLLKKKKTLVDVKTCKRIYDDHFTQVGGGYKRLLIENGYPVEDARILRIGRDESEGFEDIRIPNQDLHMKRFLLCKELYDLNKKLKG